MVCINNAQYVTVSVLHWDADAYLILQPVCCCYCCSSHHCPNHVFQGWKWSQKAAKTAWHVLVPLNAVKGTCVTVPTPLVPVSSSCWYPRPSPHCFSEDLQLCFWTNVYNRRRVNHIWMWIKYRLESISALCPCFNGIAHYLSWP